MQYDRKSIERCIQEINSKHCEKILRIIYEDDGIHQGDLAHKMELLPSGLRAVIKKMEECSLPLVQVEQNGKFRKCRLPEYMKQYFEELECENSDTLKEQMKAANLFLLLQRFVEAVGDDWKEVLNLLLLNEEMNVSVKTMKTFSDFMNQMMMKTVEKDEEVYEIKAFIKNEVLIYLMEKYMEANM